jgi:hypothetical protein
MRYYFFEIINKKQNENENPCFEGEKLNYYGFLDELIFFYFKFTFAWLKAFLCYFFGWKTNINFHLTS